jgi:hypothetical protein
MTVLILHVSAGTHPLAPIGPGRAPVSDPRPTSTAATELAGHEQSAHLERGAQVTLTPTWHQAGIELAAVGLVGRGQEIAHGPPDEGQHAQAIEHVPVRVQPQADEHDEYARGDCDTADTEDQPAIDPTHGTWRGWHTRSSFSAK